MAETVPLAAPRTTLLSSQRSKGSRRVIATGRSQSAFRLVTYINAIHPLANLYQGFLVHSRGAGAAGLRAEGLAPDTPSAIPPGAHIRSDTKVPVLDVQAEGDMTLHGATKKVSLPLQVQRNGDKIRIVGNYDFVWADFGMTAPSIAGFVSVTGNPKLEFDVTMSKQA